MDISLPDDLEFAEEGRDHDDTELRFTEDGILIEPFNLGAERSGGYFDNEDNYVARVNKDDTDAWMQAMEGALLLPCVISFHISSHASLRALRTDADVVLTLRQCW